MKTKIKLSEEDYKELKYLTEHVSDVKAVIYRYLCREHYLDYMDFSFDEELNLINSIQDKIQ